MYIFLVSSSIHVPGSYECLYLCVAGNNGVIQLESDTECDGVEKDILKKDKSVDSPFNEIEDPRHHANFTEMGFCAGRSVSLLHSVLLLCECDFLFYLSNRVRVVIVPCQTLIAPI